MKFNFQNLFSKIKRFPLRDNFFSLRFLNKVMTLSEKIIVLILIVLIIGLGSIIWYQSWIKSTQLIPGSGGKFVEGFVGESKNLGEHTTRLLNAGLTKYDNEGKVVGDIAQNWDINEGGKVYIFHLREGFNAEDLILQIKNANVWQDIDISAPDEVTLKFTFKQPFSPFLNISTEPIFNYGPYKITKEYKDGVELQSREDYYNGQANISKLFIKFYQTEEALIRAAEKGDIQAYSLRNDEAPLDNFTKFEMKLPRDLNVFFNLSKKELQDINVRRALKENISPGKELNLRLVTSDNDKNNELATHLVDQLSQKGIKITLDVKDNVTLQKETIPKRDYDLLLYGLDYGEDPDPYPFWHSSQIKVDGKNLSNFKNAKADKLLEDARQEFDSAKRESYYEEFQKILDSEIPMFVVEHQNFYYYVSDEIKGIENTKISSETDRFVNVASWYIKTKRVKI